MNPDELLRDFVRILSQMYTAQATLTVKDAASLEVNATAFGYIWPTERIREFRKLISETQDNFTNLAKFFSKLNKSH